MKKFLAVTTVLCLVMGFQNCSQSNLNGDVLSAGLKPLLPATENGGEAVDNVSYVEIPNNGSDAGSLSQKASDGASFSRLVISAQNGAINVLDDSDAVIAQKCLSAADLNELNSILIGSSICSAEAVSAEQVCGMRYKPAYAALLANNEVVNLGEEKDSCGSGKRDLCGDLALVFQNFVSYVKTNYQNMNCQ